MVTVYTIPACPQCDMTKKYLTREGIEYSEVDLSNDEVAMEKVRGLGYTAAPVVEVGSDHWSGFRLDMLKLIRKAA